MPRVAIIDHGLGNLQAVEKALGKAAGGGPVFRCYEPELLDRADCVVLPGTGALDACVNELRRLGMAELLPRLAQEKPLLAINTGFHALGRRGLGILDFDSMALNADGRDDIRLPHIGWNRAHRCQAHALWDGLQQDAHFYFAHRLRAVADEPLIGATACYGERFPAMVAHGLIVGVQFHPEISHENGLRFLANFANWGSRAAA